MRQMNKPENFRTKKTLKISLIFIVLSGFLGAAMGDDNFQIQNQVGSDRGAVTAGNYSSSDYSQWTDPKTHVHYMVNGAECAKTFDQIKNQGFQEGVNYLVNVDADKPPPAGYGGGWVCKVKLTVDNTPAQWVFGGNAQNRVSYQLGGSGLCPEIDNHEGSSFAVTDNIP